MGRLDFDSHRGAGLKEAYCCIRRIRRLVCVEPEVIQRAEANSIGVCVLRDSFAVPSYRRVARLVIIHPRRAAISGISLGAIMRKARMLRWHVKPDVTDIDSRSQRNSERLNGPIEVLVIEGVLVVPDASRRVGHLVTHEPDTIVAVIRFDLTYRRTIPSFNGRLLSESVAHEIKGERLVDSNYAALTVGCVVIHVALVRMTLAPGAFVWDDVFCFGKVGRPDVKRSVQIANVNQNPVNELTQAREPIRSWAPFKPAPYASEQPEPR